MLYLISRRPALPACWLIALLFFSLVLQCQQIKTDQLYDSLLARHIKPFRGAPLTAQPLATRRTTLPSRSRTPLQA
jgi:hypothetical protein